MSLCIGRHILDLLAIIALVELIGYKLNTFGTCFEDRRFLPLGHL